MCKDLGWTLNTVKKKVMQPSLRRHKKVMPPQKVYTKFNRVSAVTCNVN